MVDRRRSYEPGPPHAYSVHQPAAHATSNVVGRDAAALWRGPASRSIAAGARYMSPISVPNIGPTGRRATVRPATTRALQRTATLPQAPSGGFRASALQRLVRHLVSDENFARRIQASPRRAIQAADYLNDHERGILHDSDPDLVRKLAQAALDYSISKQSGDVDVFGHDEALQGVRAAASGDETGSGGRNVPGFGPSQGDQDLDAVRALGDDDSGSGGRHLPGSLGFGPSGVRGAAPSGLDTDSSAGTDDILGPGASLGGPGRFGSGAQWTSQMREALKPGEAVAEDKDAGGSEPSTPSSGSAGGTTQSTQSSDKEFGSRSLAAQDASSEDRVLAAQAAGAILGAAAVAGTLAFAPVPVPFSGITLLAGGVIGGIAGFKLFGDLQKNRERAAGFGHLWMPSDEGTGPVGPRIRPGEAMALRSVNQFNPNPDASGAGPGGPRLHEARLGQEAMPVPDEAGGGGPTGPWANVYKPDPESSSPGTPHSRALDATALHGALTNLILGLGFQNSP